MSSYRRSYLPLSTSSYSSRYVPRSNSRESTSNFLSAFQSNRSTASQIPRQEYGTTGSNLCSSKYGGTMGFSKRAESPNASDTAKTHVLHSVNKNSQEISNSKLPSYCKSSNCTDRENPYKYTGKDTSKHTDSNPMTKDNQMSGSDYRSQRSFGPVYSKPCLSESKSKDISSLSQNYKSSEIGDKNIERFDRDRDKIELRTREKLDSKKNDHSSSGNSESLLRYENRIRDSKIASAERSLAKPTSFYPSSGSRYNSASTYEKSGYISDAKSGYGSDYSRSGYGSSYNSGNEAAKRTIYGNYTNFSGKENDLFSTNNSYRSSYSRQNSVLSSDAGSGSTWRSKVYGEPDVNSLPLSRPTSLTFSSNDQSDSHNHSSQKSPKSPKSAFQSAIGKLSQECKENSNKENKKSELVSPNAVKVLPSFEINGIKVRNKAPADFSSASEIDSEVDENAKGNEQTNSLNINGDIEIRKESHRTLTHLCQAPPLPTRNESLYHNLSPIPNFRTSARYSSSLHELVKNSSSRNLKSHSSVEKSPSPNVDEIKTDVVSITSPDNVRKNESSKLPHLSPVINKPPLNIGNKEHKGSSSFDNASEREKIQKQLQEQREVILFNRRKHGLDTEDFGTHPSILQADCQTADKSIKSASPKQNLRKSGSFKRYREKVSPRISKNSSSSSSSSESESEESASKTESISKASIVRRTISRTSSKDRTERRYSITSGSISKINRSRNKLIPSRDGSRSRNNSKNSIANSSDNSKSIFDKRLSSDSIKGEVAATCTISVGTKNGKKLASTDSSSSDEESDSDESSTSSTESEEGCLFSISKTNKNGLKNDVDEFSKSKTNRTCSKANSDAFSKSQINHLCTESNNAAQQCLSHDSKSSDSISKLGVRTSPDGSEGNNEIKKKGSTEDASDKSINFNIAIPINKEKPLRDSVCSRDESSNNAKNSDLKPKTSNLSYKEQNDSNTDNDVSEIPEFDVNANVTAQVIPNENKENCEYGVFEWPPSSPELPRKPQIIQEEKAAETSGYEPFEWPSGSPEIKRRVIGKHLTENVEGSENQSLGEFHWPEGSPPIVRKKRISIVLDNSLEKEHLKGIPNSEQENCKTESEFQWPQNSEQENDKTESEFQWPESPVPERKVSASIELEVETSDFEWPDSPKYPIMKEPGFSTFTKDIDNLLEEEIGNETFIEMETKLGFGSKLERDEYANDRIINLTDNRVVDSADNEDVDSVEDENSAENSIYDNKSENVSLYYDSIDDKNCDMYCESIRTSKNSKIALLKTQKRDNLSEDNLTSKSIQKLTEKSERDNNSGTKYIVKDNSVEKAEKSSLKERAKKNLSKFIDKLSAIDEIFGNRTKTKSESDDILVEEFSASDVKIHDGEELRANVQSRQRVNSSAVLVLGSEKEVNSSKAEIALKIKKELDDAALQVFRDGDAQNYLDLEASLAEQADDLDGLTDSKKNSIVVRTQLSVRVHAIKEKLLKSDGRELRRALFSLKQIFQDDKDLVHEFVQNDGLTCLVKVGSSVDHNYQAYILRALGQVMLYVDGMTGISNSKETVQWLYSLVSSKFRLVVKTALKLLLVFVEYSEHNAMILCKAVKVVDKSRGNIPWAIVMHLLEGRDCPDTALQIYAMTLVNKTLNGLPDQDSYYDQTDCLEEQNLELLIQKLMHNPNSDLDLLQQLTIYQAVLAYEDGDDICRTRTIDPNIRQDLRHSATSRDALTRRRSKRHYAPPIMNGCSKKIDESSSDEELLNHVTVINVKGGALPTDDLKHGVRHADAGVTPGLKRRRERAATERQKTLENENNAMNECESEVHENGLDARKNSEISWLLELMSDKKDVKDIASRIASLMEKENVDNCKKSNFSLTSDSCVKEILEKLSRGTSITAAEHEKLTRIGDVSGRIQKAKGNLFLKTPQNSNLETSLSREASPEPPKKSENDLYWENILNNLNRPLQLCDLDFSDLNTEDDRDIFSIQHGGIPPPPPPPPPAPPFLAPGRNSGGTPQPPMENGMHTDDDSTSKSLSLRSKSQLYYKSDNNNKFQKTKKTIKLFWKEVRNDPKSESIWNELEQIKVDVQKLEHLFESRANVANTKKQQDQKGLKELIVLDSKRSNVINIGMTKLPPPRTIKTAIMKMDSSIINKEGIEKILQTMVPTTEEKKMIQEAAVGNPELPLGSAEQFLMMLASISELPARLNLWLFKLDFEVMEKEVAETLMDLKQGIESLYKNKTFKIVISTLLSIGNFLNGVDSKGFQLEYLSKVPEVKDTVHKHSLLHHLCQIVTEKFPNTSDLYSEIGSITRVSKVDFDELQSTVEKMETDCKASWDHLKAIAKHDGPTQMKLKLSEFLADAAERTMVLDIIFRRVIHRFRCFLLWLGMPPNYILESKPQKICSTISEFSLEYRTCRERVLQQIEKKANHRERNKTRGKMITEMEKFRCRSQTKDEEADTDLQKLLNLSDVSDTEAIRGKNTWKRTRESKTKSRIDESMAELILMSADGGMDDALLDSLLKTATQSSKTRATPRERKRSRHVDRKSLRRTLKNGLTDEEKQMLSVIMTQIKA